MATMKKAAPKAQKGKSVMKAYVDKYKNEGGISNMDVARDTLGGSSPRNNQYSGGFGGGRMNQIKDLQAAHDKKFGKKSTIDERKNGGPVKKAQKGASMEDPFARKLPKKVGVLPSMTRIGKEKDSTFVSIKKGKPEGFKKGPSVSKMKYKNGGSLSALSASNKRDKGIDPKGAFTKVQKKTLAGAKGKASLTKDKQLGATKMKCGGKMKKK
jgi:hypothetical protein